MPIDMNSKVFSSFLSLLLMQFILSADSRAIREERELAKSKLTHKFRRSVGASVHDYALTVFNQSSEWKKRECNVNFNCWRVNPAYCTTNTALFVPPDDNARVLKDFGCILDFTASIKSTDTVRGADLSLYTKSSKNMFVFLVDYLDEFPYQISSRYIPSTCGGWQTFEINERKFIDGFKAETVHREEILIMVYMELEKENFSTVSCDEIKNVFYMDINTNFSTHSLHKREVNPGREGDKEQNGNAQTSTQEPQTDEPTTENDDRHEIHVDTFNSTTTSTPEAENGTLSTQPREEILQNKFLPRLTMFIDETEPHQVS